MEHIVIVGGGAGGLVLATRLGKKLRRESGVEVTLVDRQPSHLWKPLLHEVAAGTLDSSFDELSFRFQGKRKHFNFQRGELTAVHPDKRAIELAAEYDEDGELLLPAREINYDYLVLAVGGVTNDYGTSGAKEHCYFLDNKPQAEHFHDFLLRKAKQKAYLSGANPELYINIVGGGATGVELAAELANAAQQLEQYLGDLDRVVTFRVNLLEAGPRILGGLPESLSDSARRTLERVHVNIRCNVAVKHCDAQGLILEDGEEIPGDIQVWAAGVKAPDWLKNIPGLETNKRNQLVVQPTLLCRGSDRIFAMGDCASFTQPDGAQVPPRAQAAHQMASVIYHNLLRGRRGEALKHYHYRDLGSLVSLSRYNTVGGLFGGELKVGGLVARLAYLSLYRVHLMAVHGILSSILIAITDRLHSKIKPRLKLH